MIERIKQKLKSRKNKDPWAEYEREVRRLYGHEGESRSSRLKTVAKGIGATLIGAGILTGAAMASNAEVASETKHMNEKFEPVLQPVAEDIADFALDKVAETKEEGWDSTKGDGYIVPDDDPGKFYVHFDGADKDGSYKVDAIVGKDAKGNPDPSSVDYARLTTTSGEEGDVMSMTTQTTIQEKTADVDYWGAGRGTHHPGSPDIDTGYTTYYGDSPEAVENDVEMAKGISDDVRHDIEKLRAA